MCLIYDYDATSLTDERHCKVTMKEKKDSVVAVTKRHNDCGWLQCFSS